MRHALAVGIDGGLPERTEVPAGQLERVAVRCASMIDAGESKVFMSTRDTVIRAFMAGAILALAAAFAVTITVQTGQPLAAAVLFPVGFCMLYLLGFDLLTGVFTLSHRREALDGRRDRRRTDDDPRRIVAPLRHRILAHPWDLPPKPYRSHAPRPAGTLRIVGRSCSEAGPGKANQDFRRAPGGRTLP